MILISSLIKQFEAEFLRQYRGRMLPSHYQALGRMKYCRTAVSPRMLVGCTQCDQQVLVPHSCGHRSCPHCQSHESQQWLERQLKKQVPANYFLLTFTLPAQLRSLAWQHQRELFALMIQSAWDTVRTFSENDKALQGIPGAIAVLHTHSRQLDFHPHVHLVMPAAAIHTKHRLWRTKSTAKDKKPYLFNHKALAKVFRAKMLEGITHAGLTLPARYPEQWVVDCKPVGSGAKALIYLGRYLYKGVIQEKDIVACEKGRVTYRYRDSKTRKLKYTTVPGPQFLWRVLQHVLPKRFRRARNFGFLHPNSKRLIQLLQLILRVDLTRGLKMLKQRPQMVCACCGAKMKIIKTLIAPPFTVHAALPT